MKYHVSVTISWFHEFNEFSALENEKINSRDNDIRHAIGDYYTNVIIAKTESKVIVYVNGDLSLDQRIGVSRTGDMIVILSILSNSPVQN